jgi:MFS family permease
VTSRGAAESDGEVQRRSVDRSQQVLLGLAAVAVMFAAADTYVVVLALPDMMGSAGLSADELQRAAPIISGFLLGYVAVLPLIGRIADLRGRVPVLVGCLVLFAVGSLVTAVAFDLPSMVTGRVLQGVGGGGLLPATLALVADLYPPRERGVPLGIVGGIQELGNVLGPLYGALVISFGTWRDIFWINLAVALVLAAVIRGRVGRPAAAHRPDLVGLATGLLCLVCLVLVMAEPDRLASDVTWGLALVPVAGDSRWVSPLGLAMVALAAAFVLRLVTARHPLVDLGSWRGTLHQVDVWGSLLLSVALGAVILAFSTSDPAVQVFSPAGPYLLALSALAGAGFWWRNRRAEHPLVPPGAIARMPAWGAMVVSFFVGAALIAALVDIPVFARVTVHNDSQLEAALVLVRFLVGLPLGALLGGVLTHRFPAGVVTALAMAASAYGFWTMSRWSFDALESPWSTVPLLLAGFGVGLAMAPTNAALLASTSDSAHGVSSALLVVSRSVGKLVGLSVLTSVGLRAYYADQDGLPAPMDVCGEGVSRCAAYSRLLQDAGLVQLHTIFLGATVCCVVAGVVALVVFRGADTRHVHAAAFEGATG